MEQERLNQKRYSQGSIRSMSSDRLSLQRILEDFKTRVPRYNDIVFVMSIESENQSKRRRGQDSIENKQYNSIIYSNHQKSMEIETHNLSTQSQGIFEKYEQKKQIYFLCEQGITHQCDCYRVCKGQECACSKTLFIQPCKQGKCCVQCIQKKNKKILWASQQQTKIISQNQIILSQIPQKTYYQPVADIKALKTKHNRDSCFCQKSKCSKKNCPCFGSGEKCNKLCKCIGCINILYQTKISSELVFSHSSNTLTYQIPKQLPMSIEFTNFELPNFYNVK